MIPTSVYTLLGVRSKCFTLQLYHLFSVFIILKCLSNAEIRFNPMKVEDRKRKDQMKPSATDPAPKRVKGVVPPPAQAASRSSSVTPSSINLGRSEASRRSQNSPRALSLEPPPRQLAVVKIKNNARSAPPSKETRCKPTTTSGAPSSSTEGNAVTKMSLLERPRLGRDLFESVMPIVDLEVHQKNKLEEIANHGFEQLMHVSFSFFSSLSLLFFYFNE